MAQADGSLTQIDDIHSVKLLGTSWLVHVVQWSYCFTFKCLVSIFTELFAARFQPSTLLNSTCIDLLRVILYAICVAAVCLKSHTTVSLNALAAASSCTCFAAAAAIIYNYSNNQQQQQRSRSILPRPNALTRSHPFHTKIFQELSW